MLKIDTNAFRNCLALKEFHFEKFDEVPDFKSKFNERISKDYSIIMKDKLYNKWFNENIEVNALRVSQYIQQQIDKLNNSKILSTIYLLSNAMTILSKEYSATLTSIIEILQKKYNIQQSDIKEFELLKNKEKMYELEQ